MEVVRKSGKAVKFPEVIRGEVYYHPGDNRLWMKTQSYNSCNTVNLQTGELFKTDDWADCVIVNGKFVEE